MRQNEQMPTVFEDCCNPWGIVVPNLFGAVSAGSLLMRFQPLVSSLFG